MTNPLIFCLPPMLAALLFAIALGLDWRRFGRPAHTLCWTLAFLAFALHWLAMAGLAAGPQPPFRPAGLPALASTVAVLLLAQGLRLRVARGAGGRMLAVIGGGIAAALLLAGDIAGADVAPLLPILSAAGLLVAAAVVTPTSQHPRAAERAATALLLGAALVKLGFGWLMMQDGDGHIAAMILPAGAIVATPAYVAAGLVALHLLSADLSRDLRRLASTDPLTGVWNRRGFEETAARMLRDAPRGLPITVAIADIDAFKALNDRHGHPAGDAALVRFAGLMTAARRHQDLIGRIGGEEFVMLMLGCSGRDALARIEAVREAVAAPCAGPAMTASFGIAELRGDEVGLAAMLGEADAALYRAKREGRNRSVLAG